MPIGTEHAVQRGRILAVSEIAPSDVDISGHAADGAPAALAARTLQSMQPRRAILTSVDGSFCPHPPRWTPSAPRRPA